MPMWGAFQLSLQVHNLGHKREGNSWASILHPVSRWIHAGLSTHHKFPEPRLRLIEGANAQLAATTRCGPVLQDCGMNHGLGLADIVVPTQRWGEFARLAYSSCFMKVRPLLAKSPCAPAWHSCCCMEMGITQAELCLSVSA